MRRNIGQHYQFPTPHTTQPSQQHIAQQQQHSLQQQQHSLQQYQQHQQRQQPHLQHQSERSNRLQQQQQQQRSSTPKPKPIFLIENFDQPSYPGYHKRTSTFLSHGKRKSDTESTFHPRTKQQITEERITSSMQQLSLEIDVPINNAMHQPQSSTRTIDEGFYEELNNSSSDEELDVEQRESELWSGSKFKQIYFTPGVKESLFKLDDDILPRRILNEMNQSCLALVPYQPPLVSALIHSTKNEKIELVYNRHNKDSFKPKSEMDIDDDDTDGKMII